MSTNEAVKLETIKLYQGVESGEGVSTLTKLIADGADVNWKNLKKEGSSALHAAVRRGNERTVKMLLDHGADISAVTTPDLNTPLHLAAALNQTAIATLILAEADTTKVQGVDKHKWHALSAENQYGNTPLHSACKSGALAIVKALVEKDAKVNAKNHRGSTPLHFAVYGDEENLELLQYLHKKGARISVEDLDGVTPLIAAAAKGHQSVVSFLLKNGADPAHKDKMGKTAEMHAKTRGRTKLAAMLKVQP